MNMHDPNCNDPNCPGLPEPEAPPVELITSCGHKVDMPPEMLLKVLDYIMVGAMGGAGATMDCPECGTLQMMLPAKMVVHTHNFHEWMHKKDPTWPADGVGTSYAEGGILPPHNPRHN